MEEVLWMTLQFIDGARHTRDDVSMGYHLKMASRAMRCALEIYGDHLAQNRAEMEQGEKSGSKIQGDVDANGGRLHGDDPSSWVS
jgi:hypothetical protein